MRIVRAGFAALLAAVASLVLFVFFGMMLPVWLMLAVYGRQAVQEAPAHGGIILFATLPIAGLISVPVFLFLTVKLYRVGTSHCSHDRCEIGSTGN
jgi:hypothetical protein